jgi:hypothetical protein
VDEDREAIVRKEQYKRREEKYSRERERERDKQKYLAFFIK